MEEEMITSEASKRKRVDTSTVIAIVALLISMSSTIIGVRQSQIMLKHQEVASDQKNASVWPYLEQSSSYYIEKSQQFGYNYSVINKGIGPAIVGDVIYLYDGKKIERESLQDKLRDKYPWMKITFHSNYPLSNTVLAPGEKIILTYLSFENIDKENHEISEIISNIDFSLDFNYRSIYGDTWNSSKDGNEKVEKLID